MLHIALSALLAVASPAPSPVPAPQGTLTPLVLPTKGPDVLLLEEKVNSAQVLVVSVNATEAFLGTYCAKYGGLSTAAAPLVQKIATTSPFPGFPMSVPCKSVTIIVGPDGSVKRAP